MKKKFRLLILFLVSIFITALSMLIKYQYCIGGAGHGFPFAIIHPGHGEFLSVYIDPILVKHGPVFDPLSIVYNTIFYMIVLALLTIAVNKCKKKLNNIRRI